MSLSTYRSPRVAMAAPEPSVTWSTLLLGAVVAALIAYIVLSGRAPAFVLRRAAPKRAASTGPTNDDDEEAVARLLMQGKPEVYARALVDDKLRSFQRVTERMSQVQTELTAARNEMDILRATGKSTIAAERNVRALEATAHDLEAERLVCKTEHNL